MAKITAAHLLLDQLKETHQSLNGTVENITDEVAAYMPPGIANPIAGTLAHLIMSEDFFTHMLLQGKPPLFATAWKDKTGASELQPTEWEKAYPKWLKEVTVDIKQLKKYGQAVNEASEMYLASLQDNDLEKDVDMSAFGMGSKSTASVISGMIIAHAREINGEIAVLKGIQGLKGYTY